MEAFLFPHEHPWGFPFHHPKIASSPSRLRKIRLRHRSLCSSFPSPLKYQVTGCTLVFPHNWVTVWASVPLAGHSRQMEGLCVHADLPWSRCVQMGSGIIFPVIARKRLSKCRAGDSDQGKWIPLDLLVWSLMRTVTTSILWWWAADISSFYCPTLNFWFHAVGLVSQLKRFKMKTYIKYDTLS